MKYHIQYHKAEELGLPNQTPIYKNGIDGFSQLNFFTRKKQVKTAKGDKCFLIVGFGPKGRMDFYLWSVINIEKIEFKDPFFWATGQGFEFSNPVRLNDFENFPQLKNYVRNFSLGFSNISSLQICNEFIELANEFENTLVNKQNIEEEWSRINEARKLNKVDRIKIIQKTNKKPEKIIVTTTAFKRNIYVIAETLERAGGNCEKCGNPAPFFKDKDGSEYLEVHHKIPLSENGEDTIENTIALCPNCHRHAHYGKKTYIDN